MRADFYGITPGEHPDFVEVDCGGITRWADLPPHEQALFLEGVERLRGLHCALGAESFGRVLRFVATEEAGIPVHAEAIPDFDPDLATLGSAARQGGAGPFLAPCLTLSPLRRSLITVSRRRI